MRHADSLEKMNAPAGGVAVTAEAHPSCRIGVIRLQPVSEVGQWDDILLAFAAMQDRELMSRQRAKTRLRINQEDQEERDVEELWCGSLHGHPTQSTRSKYSAGKVGALPH
ncbi:hypothetical protein [Bradyrhizobium sp. DOA9]|uniref:hypothetical protein n=1 Tax=Bradyrhizobium sp. DOA9 TaxID=1126627 RepID=UPI0012602420|nr:hypothetical protein [Bradyrhizobium sp. DOA9]